MIVFFGGRLSDNSDDSGQAIFGLGAFLSDSFDKKVRIKFKLGGFSRRIGQAVQAIFGSGAFPPNLLILTISRVTFNGVFYCPMWNIPGL